MEHPCFFLTDLSQKPMFLMSCWVKGPLFMCWVGLPWNVFRVWKCLEHWFLNFCILLLQPLSFVSLHIWSANFPVSKTPTSWHVYIPQTGAENSDHCCHCKQSPPSSANKARCGIPWGVVATPTRKPFNWPNYLCMRDFVSKQRVFDW